MTARTVGKNFQLYNNAKCRRETILALLLVNKLGRETKKALYLNVNVSSTKELELRTLFCTLLKEAGPRLRHRLLGNF